MARNTCLFENFTFDPFSTKDVLRDDDSDHFNGGDRFYDNPYFPQISLKTF